MKRNFKKGLTGIETAIILIAIVLVAAAFAFVVMNMGFGAVQKTGEAITKGTEEASSSLEVVGAVIAENRTKVPTGQYVIIYVKPGVGGMPVDANKTIVTYVVEEPSRLAKHYSKKAVVFSDNLTCTADPIETTLNTTDLSKAKVVHSYTVLACEVYGDGDHLIEIGEKWAFVINVSAIYGKKTLNDIWIPYLVFRVEIKPPTGAVLVVERRLPAAITPVMETW